MISWASIRMSNQLKYLRDRNLPCLEMDVTGYHYWVFYTQEAAIQSDETFVFPIEGVLFLPRHAADSLGVHAIERAFSIPGDWLRDNGGTLYHLFHEKIVAREVPKEKI